MVYYCFTTIRNLLNIIRLGFGIRVTHNGNSCQLPNFVGGDLWWPGSNGAFGHSQLRPLSLGHHGPWLASSSLRLPCSRVQFREQLLGWTFDILPLHLPNYFICPYCVCGRIKRCWLDWAMVAVRFWEFQLNSWCTAAGMLPSHS